MTNSTTINGTTFNIKSEVEMTGKMTEQGFYKTMLILTKPRGTKEFWAMRDLNGNITLN